MNDERSIDAHLHLPPRSAPPGLAQPDLARVRRPISVVATDTNRAPRLGHGLPLTSEEPQDNTMNLDHDNRTTPTTTGATTARPPSGRRPLPTTALVSSLVGISFALMACTADNPSTAASERTVPAADPTTPSTSAPTLPATTPPATVAVPAEQAVASVREYLATFAGGDPDAPIALQTADFVMRSAFPGDALDEQRATDWLGVTYQAAVGTTYDDLDCTADEEGLTATIVMCDAAMVTTIHRETNTAGVPSRLVITVTADGIAALDLRYLQNFGVFGFYEWRDGRGLNEPDDSTIDGMAEFGRAEAGLAAEYVSVGVSTVEDAFAALDDGDVDGFMQVFLPGQMILGVSWEDAPSILSGLVAAGGRYDVTECEPAGVERFNLRIECTASLTAAGAGTPSETTGTVTAFYNVDGVIERITSTIDLDDR